MVCVYLVDSTQPVQRNMPTAIHAVIVTYQCGERIRTALAALMPQVAHTVVVDNGSAAATQAALTCAQRDTPHLTIIRNPDNRGLAAAQNQGIRAALAHGATWVLLLDDDSIPQPDMLELMLAAAQDDEAIGIVAPRYIEQRVEVASRYLATYGRYGALRRGMIRAGDVTRDALTVIASGSLIRGSLFSDIGLMREGFFIDYIDHDFCLRARSAGYRIMLVGDALLLHSQGNKTLHCLMGYYMVTANYSPLRRYFIFRNRLFVLRTHARSFPFLLPYAVLAYGWDMLRILLLEQQKSAKTAAALRGLWHGLLRPIPAAG